MWTENSPPSPTRQPPDPERQAARRRAVIEHVQEYGVTTLPVLVRILSCPGRTARGLVRTLTREERLYLHRRGQTQYYSLDPRALSPSLLREKLAVLWYCCKSRPQKKLIPRQMLRELSLPEARCCQERGRRIGLIRVAKPARAGQHADLNRVLASMQRFIRAEPFAPWLTLVAANRFVLVYLMSDVSQAEELTAWVQRRPLLSYLRQPPVRIPVKIVAVRVA